MKYILSESQLSTFLRRRFTKEKIDEMVHWIKVQIDEGDSVDDAVYTTVRHYLSQLDIDDIINDGSEQDYWDSYISIEAPLVAYLKSVLDLE